MEAKDSEETLLKRIDSYDTTMRRRIIFQTKIFHASALMLLFTAVQNLALMELNYFRKKLVGTESSQNLATRHITRSVQVS